MITLRPAAQRGVTRLNWLDSRHTFSFNEYYDPRHTEFRGLRVINDDRVAPGSGFPMHGHRDMEILTWVWEGALEHKDSTGAGRHPADERRHGHPAQRIQPLVQRAGAVAPDLD